MEKHSTQDPAYPLYAVLAMANEITAEDNPSVQAVTSGKMDPGFYYSFFVYPKATAHE